jgi:hypothetical protein
MTIKAVTNPTHLEEFLARTKGMSATPGFDVEKDLRAGPILANPAHLILARYERT